MTGQVVGLWQLVRSWMWTASSNWIWTVCCSYDCHQTKRTNASFRDPGVLFFLVTRHPWDLTQHRKPTHGA
eukprot:COSAG05_NODE_5910_length_1061_cov_0.843035_2_plen_71_part_00